MPVQRGFFENDHVIEAFSPDRADEACVVLIGAATARLIVAGPMGVLC